MRPVTARQAVNRLDRSAVTIRQWARCYTALTLDKTGRDVVYDFDNLATIEGCIWRGEPVPATPEDRAELRAELARQAAA